MLDTWMHTSIKMDRWMLDYESYGLATELLKLVPWDDLRSITRTISDGLIVPNGRDEAIKAILQHSRNPEELLSRQKITKDVLFAYLHKKNVKCPQRDKQTLKQMVLELWSGMPSNNVAQNTLCQSTTVSSEHVIQPAGTYGQVTSDQLVMAGPSSVITGPSSTEFMLHGSTVTSTTVDANELAVKFAEWFYSLLNQTAPETDGFPRIIGPEHFFQDCSIHLCMESSSGCITKDIQRDALGVAKLLVNTKIEHNLYFNPNISSNGIRGKMDRHGLVLVAVCGTLHQDDNCAGVFDQLFGLARDPFAENNWKIKYTEINLKSQELVNGTPSLENSDTGRKVLALPDVET